MEGKFRIVKYEKTYAIQKIKEENLSINELKELLDILIAEGKGDYSVHTEGFCCGTSWISIFDKCKEISLD